MQNQRSEVANNAARNITGSHKLDDQLKDSDRVHNNLRGTGIAALLKDPDSLDFRPKEGSPLIGAGAVIPGCADGLNGKAPDIGAYECGGARWIPGADWQEGFTALDKGQKSKQPQTIKTAKP